MYKGISIASRKAKARRLQNWVAQKIANLLNAEWGKDKEIAPRIMGDSGVDVLLQPHILKQFNYSIECKNSESLNLWKALEQSKANQLSGTDWLLFVKRNNEEPIVVLDAEVFFDIQRALRYLIDNRTENRPVSNYVLTDKVINKFINSGKEEK